MILSLIAAIGKNNELGKDNNLVFNLPKDMKHFRETTSGHAVIMGRKTFESIGKALPNRRNIVITRDGEYKKEGVEVVHSLEDALKLFENSDEEVFVIGGGEIYKQAIPYANKLYITHVDATIENADTFFPEFDLNEWNKTSYELHHADEKNIYNFEFANYEKK